MVIAVRVWFVLMNFDFFVFVVLFSGLVLSRFDSIPCLIVLHETSNSRADLSYMRVGAALRTVASVKEAATLGVLPT